MREITWNKTTKDTYWEILEILPPAIMTGDGFLVGEPADHRACSVTGDMLPRYEAFLERHGKHYVASTPLTIPEFRRAARPWH